MQKSTIGQIVGFLIAIAITGAAATLYALGMPGAPEILLVELALFIPGLAYWGLSMPEGIPPTNVVFRPLVGAFMLTNFNLGMIGLIILQRTNLFS